MMGKIEIMLTREKVRRTGSPAIVCGGGKDSGLLVHQLPAVNVQAKARNKLFYKDLG